MGNVFSKITAPIVLLCLLAGCECRIYKYFTRSAEEKKESKNIMEVVDKTKFEEVVLKYEKPVVAKFTASWCGACRQMASIYENAADKYKDKVRFVEVDVDKAEEISKEYEIKGIPAFLYFKDGKETNRIAGAMDAEEFSKTVEKLLEK